ncbi:MAG: DNA mismatch endonuclease Vsr [Gemmataceae bacterium]|nr:DNA mismatch endonuclease Vsr [Gemmataceae bacterium]
MADIMDAEARSRLMARIRGKDTKPEKAVRRLLHGMGYRFRLHAKGLPGRPDIVLPRHRAVVFVHGCFWHRHAECKPRNLPATNTDYWREKFRANAERDERKTRELAALGWRVHVVWECQLREPDTLAARLLAFLRGEKPATPRRRSKPVERKKPGRRR